MDHPELKFPTQAGKTLYSVDEVQSWLDSVLPAYHDQIREDASKRIDALLAHCEDAECHVCSCIICPHQHPLHFHHDGCPACAEAEEPSREAE